ncbi:MAG TPA: outer membrane lipoprotein carrier protein LolA [Candidatus Binataceae bacterium]|nr:outer membrane lipoprotein carrier protein LolA [Candidatus Binataceae bacterium]
MKLRLHTKIAGILALAIIASAPRLYAAPSGLESILTRVQNHYRDTNSFHAKFTEEVTSPGGMKKTRTGVVYYLKPGRMRWEFAAPDTETIVSDGTIVYSYEPDLNQVIETPVKQILKSPNATTFLLGFGDLRRDFKASTPSPTPGDGLIHLTLVPKDGGNQAEVGLDRRTLNLVTLRLTDAVGDRTLFQFSDWTNNPALQDSLFKFEVPPGADIVRTTGAS